MTAIYLLHHVHEFDDGHEDVKLIGGYTSEQSALEAKQRVFNKPGFRERPSGFIISELVLNRDGWVDGYVTV